LLYEAVRSGSESYHNHPKVWDRFYVSYMQDKRQELWDSCTVDELEAGRLIRFLNQWSTHYQTRPAELATAINSVLPILNRLAEQDLLHVDFGQVFVGSEPASYTIEMAFDVIAGCGRRYESTGASKILHTLNPRLFVMWDAGIRAATGIRGQGDGLGYAHRFLPKMQQLAKTVVAECMRDCGVSESGALRVICTCGHSLAKVIDEYNWATHVGGAVKSPDPRRSGEASESPGPLPEWGPSASESDVITRITERLSRTGGSADVPLQKAGRTFGAELRPGGVSVDNLHNQPFLPWRVFTETVALLQRNGGVARRGDAMNCKLGDAGLPLNSVEGHVASAVYARKRGDSVFRRVTPIAAILEWCGLCHHAPGEIRLVRTGAGDRR
jgi:hypothetical protein